MQIKVRYLENLRLEANFDDFQVIADQPIRYKGDGTAPGPFDYFLASSVMCAAYFVKVYCNSRGISTEDIRVYQDNIVDPENRYKQTFNIQVELPASLSDKDREGILRSIERCTVKRVIQNNPEFIITPKDVLGSDQQLKLHHNPEKKTEIVGKDCSLEETIENMTSLLNNLGIKIEIASWRNPVPHVWSVHIRDADSPICFSNGKGATKEAALCSALGEYIERLSNNYFYNDYYLGKEIANSEFVHYPDEKWFPIELNDEIPHELMDSHLKNIYGADGDLKASHLIDSNSGNKERGICALPYIRQSDSQKVYIPVNLIGNIFVSNGMSAGNSKYEARVQALSEIFERAVKNEIIREEISLPDIPLEVLKRYPHILEGIQTLEEQGYPLFIKDASLGGKYPVISVTLMNPRTGGVFASFGSHPKFEVALERSLTELLQGRSFEGLNDLPAPTFNEFAISEHNNIIDHFIDSTGVISWNFFNQQSSYDFVDWNCEGSTEDEYNYLMNILKALEKEVYIADYNELGAHACRILVPEYSEIYESQDLIWDNNNRALDFRERILNIHELNEKEVISLIEKIEEHELDDYMPISELIGVAFDDNSVWSQCTLGELKGLSYLCLGELENAKHHIEMLMTFNDSLPERKKLYQALNTLLDIELRENISLENMQPSLNRMFGQELTDLAIKTIKREINFPGLTKTCMNLSNIDKHQRLLASYQKLQKAKKAYHSNK